MSQEYSFLFVSSLSTWIGKEYPETLINSKSAYRV